MKITQPFQNIYEYLKIQSQTHKNKTENKKRKALYKKYIQGHVKTK